MGLLHPPRNENRGLATKPPSRILRKINNMMKRRPKSKTQKAVEKEIANGFRGFKKFVKDVAEVGE